MSRSLVDDGKEEEGLFADLDENGKREKKGRKGKKGRKEKGETEEEKKKREELELLMIDEVRVECGSEG